MGPSMVTRWLCCYGSPDTLLSSTRLKNLTRPRLWELTTLELSLIPEIYQARVKGTRVETETRPLTLFRGTPTRHERGDSCRNPQLCSLGSVTCLPASTGLWETLR